MASKNSDNTNHDCLKGTCLIRDTPVERDSHVETTVNTSSELGVTGAQPNIKPSSSKRRRLRKKENKEKEKMRLGHNDLQGCSSTKYSDNICLKNESGVTQPNGSVSLSMEKSKGKEDNAKSIPSLNYGLHCDPQMANGNHIANEDMKSVPEVVPEKQSGLLSKENTGLMETRDLHPEVGIVESERNVVRKREVNTYHRKTRKTSDFLGNSLEPMKEDGMGQTLSGHLEKAHTVGLSENKLDGVQLGGDAASAHISKDTEMEGVPANRLDDVPASKDSNKRLDSKIIMEISEVTLMDDLSVLDVQKKHLELKNSGKLDDVQITMQDALHRDCNCKELPFYCKDKPADLSCCATSCKHVEQKNVLSLSLLGGVKANVGLDVIVKKDYPLEILHPSPGHVCVGSSKKKLLILDLNGLLADIVPYAPAIYIPDTWVSGKAVFKRPFCDDFMRFCFQRFDVGVWSSRAKYSSIYDMLFHLFCFSCVCVWFFFFKVIIVFLMSIYTCLSLQNQSHCTATSFTTVENKNKRLVLKELRKLWEKLEPDLPWEKGEYNESNTLLLDDSPYKALRNPAHTAIFPHSYQYRDEKDFSLGPSGDIRKYLEELALADNVQKYVEQNPFGQRAITESNPSWGFYSKVIGTTTFMPTSSEGHCHSQREMVSHIES
ncbi:NIF domain-containing protein [Cephalotus follicularis]|uniref:NIF domain-containing protein n=1 Tax=Cephalotus follicularis TaxID=3775 RepID=A0A1Q3D908_CEPFO|nr:NIF domain-containing protein [Cephalotus follicularis]